MVNGDTGFEEYFGVGPHYRWSDDGESHENSWIMRVRKNAAGGNPEDAMRDLAGGAGCRNYKELMGYLYETLEKHPEISGLVAYSEGASAAATFILDEERRHLEEGRDRQIKCAMFITGWPAFNGDKGFILSDEGGEEMIDVPTLHVVGANGIDAISPCFDVWLITIYHFLSRSFPIRFICPL